jgi:hypothetical protein
MEAGKESFQVLQLLAYQLLLDVWYGLKGIIVARVSQLLQKGKMLRVPVWFDMRRCCVVNPRLFNPQA